MALLPLSDVFSVCSFFDCIEQKAELALDYLGRLIWWLSQLSLRARVAKTDCTDPLKSYIKELISVEMTINDM